MSDPSAKAASSVIDQVAVIGVAGRFPGAGSVDELWQNLRKGVVSILPLTDEQLDAAGVPASVRANPAYVKMGARMEDPDKFDAAFFGFSPREAEVMDPQQRVFLETCWEALESAGQDPRAPRGPAGVYAGAGMNTYVFNNILPNPEVVEAVGEYQTMISNDKDFLATRVSYKLDLRGPAVTVQTACSTSLVAINMACDALLDHRCDLALAGGVAIPVPQETGYLYRPGMIVSPDGRCRAFDAQAAGTVGGRGVAVVVLKRLEDALADGDPILAVVRGWAVNNDGSDKVGYTAPSVEGQAEVIADALAMGGIDPDTVGYVEAHGTGTVLGDPIEVTALNLAYGGGGGRKEPCALGAIKPNIGHLDAAAGAAGFIKTVLVLKNGEIPPLAHFEKPNPRIPFGEGPFEVNTRLRPWATDGTPRRAGVSSFGIGGTNAHTVLEEAPVREPSGPGRPAQLLVLSARTGPALERATARLADHLEAHPGAGLADVAWTLQVGRHRMPHRRSLVVTDVADAVRLLRGGDAKRVHTQADEHTKRSCAFMFTGQGAQHPGMGRALDREERTFHDTLGACCDVLEPHLGMDLRKLLYPEPGGEAEAADRLKETRLTQPALFAVEYALARLWMSWGVSPGCMIGHSIGEYVAACLAGVFSLEDGLALVAARGAAMDAMPRGSMLTIQLPEEEVLPLLDGGLSLAAVNAPSSCVVSGPHETVDRLEAHLVAHEVGCHRLHTSHAFHSAMMEPAADRLRGLLADVDLHPPEVPFVSNVTGTWITPEEATSPDYWATHLRRTVRFADGVRALLEDPDRVILEVGPGNTLVSLAKQQGAVARGRTIVSSLPRPRTPADALAHALDALGRLWSAGLRVDWAAVHSGERRRRVRLPTYPFERQHFWLEAPVATPGARASRTSPTTKEPDVADWFYLPSWTRSLPPPPAEGTAGSERWLVFDDGGAVGAALVALLEERGHRVSSVRAGSGFRRHAEGRYTLAPAEADGYGMLVDDLRAGDAMPERIVHLWSLLPLEDGEGRFDEAQRRGVFSVTNLARALARGGAAGTVELGVVTTGVHEVVPGDRVSPERATVLGACVVIPQEVPWMRCRSIDVGPAAGAADAAELVERLLREVSTGPAGAVLAFRGRHRWVRTFHRHRLDARPGGGLLREGGTYLVTGGLGGVGLDVARRLATDWKARLILATRSGLPPRATWPDRLREAGVGDRIRSILELEELGAEVMLAAVDVADTDAVRAMVEEATHRFGRIDGVIHAARGPSHPDLREVTETEFRDQFRAKALGAQALDAALRSSPPDFCVLASSLASALGGLGFTAYASANAFLDAFAQAPHETAGTAWISIQWDNWRPRGREADTDPALALSMDRAEGVETLVRVLSMDPPASMAVSATDLQARIEQWVEGSAVAGDASGGGASGTKHERPELATAYAEPRDEIERTVVGIWENLLGIGGVGVQDDFLELGGNSLSAVQVMSRLHESLGVSLPVRTLLEATTVAELSERIRTALWAVDPREPVASGSGDREELEF